MNFTVLGEAAAQLSDELKQEFASVPWRQPARLRNRIVHGYWSIDLDVVHATAQERLPGFTPARRGTRLRRWPLPQRPQALTNPRRTYKPDS